MAINTFSSASKSNRTLQSLRYTMASSDNTEAYTSVLDIRAKDIYSQTAYLPTASAGLPYSGSSGHLQYVTADIGDTTTNLAQYYFKVTCSRSDVTLDSSGKSEAWMTISGSGYDPVATNAGGGINTQTIHEFQLTDWLSNKYIQASDAGNGAQGDPPGYNIALIIDGLPVTAGFQFDYKTGILQFVDNSVAPSTSALVAISGYRYVGQTLDTFVSSSGDGTGAGFPFSGSAVITGSLLISGSDNEPVDLIISGGISLTEGITGSDASFSTGTITTLTGTDATFDTLTVNTFISSSTLITSGSNVFGDTVILNNFTAQSTSGVAGGTGLNSFNIKDATTGTVNNVKSTDKNVTASFNVATDTTFDSITLNSSTGNFKVGDSINFSSQSLGASSGNGTDLRISILQSNLVSNDTQTLIGSNIFITGSTGIDGNLNVNGTLGITGFSDVSASLAAATAGTGIFDQQGSTDVYLTSKQLLISSSDPLMATPYSGSNPTVANDGTDGTATKYSVVSSQSGWFYNHNVGVPKSKAWGTDLDGSYFNNFNHNTDTSEILRFIAGLLKDQAPDVQPNTKTLGSVVQDFTNNTSVGSAHNGFLPNGITGNATFTYLNGKGFATAGQRIFQGISPIYNNTSGYLRDFKSSATGGTTITSSNTNSTQLFGLGNIGTRFTVSSSQNWKYSDNSSKTGMASDPYSIVRIKTTASGESPVSEFTYNIIPTNNDLISPVFQDGLFENIFSQSISNPLGQTGFPTVLNAKEATGYYQMTSSFEVDYNNTNDSTVLQQELFYADTSTINSAFSANTISFSGLSLSAKTATSRSLGRTPFLKTATYAVGATVSGLFDPLYVGDSTVVNITSDSITQTPVAAAGHQKSMTFTGGTVNQNNVLVPNGQTVASARSNGSIPTINDEAIVSASISIAPTISQTNITQGGLSGDTSFEVTTIGTKPTVGGTSNTDNDRNQDYFTAGTFDQQVSNGVMAYFGGSESDAGGSTTDTTENFKTEIYRKEINNNFLPTGTAAGGGGTPTAYNVGNVYDTQALAALDLQVKPGHLIQPGGNYKYWIQSPNAGLGGARFYGRMFDYQGSSTIKSITITFNSGIDLDDASTSPWLNPSSNSISVLVFNKTQPNTYAHPLFVDIADYTNTGNPGNITTTGGATNPFNQTITVMSNNNTTTGVPAAPAYKVATNQFRFNDITSGNSEWGMLIRYNGDPAPIKTISVSYSTS